MRAIKGHPSLTEYMQKRELVDRVRSKCTIDEDTGCWVWYGSGNSPVISFKGTTVRVKGTLYRIYHPEFRKVSFYGGCEVNDLCLNPEHLKEDLLNRERPKKGRFRKLNLKKLETIKIMLREGVKQKEIARTFKIAQSMVSDIKRGKAWKKL